MRERYRPKTEAGAGTANEVGYGAEAVAGAPAASTNVDMLCKTGAAAYAPGPGSERGMEGRRGHGV